jgi:hypothetical protein
MNKINLSEIIAHIETSKSTLKRYLPTSYIHKNEWDNFSMCNDKNEIINQSLYCKSKKYINKMLSDDMLPKSQLLCYPKSIDVPYYGIELETHFISLKLSDDDIYLVRLSNFINIVQLVSKFSLILPCNLLNKTDTCTNISIYIAS